MDLTCRQCQATIPILDWRQFQELGILCPECKAHHYIVAHAQAAYRAESVAINISGDVAGGTIIRTRGNKQ